MNSSGSRNDCVLFYGKPVKEISYTNEWLLVEESLVPLFVMSVVVGHLILLLLGMSRRVAGDDDLHLFMCSKSFEATPEMLNKKKKNLMNRQKTERRLVM